MDGKEKSSSYSKFTKVKCQVVHAYVMKVYRGSGGKSPDVNFGTRCSSVSITFRLLYQQERTPIPLGQETEWAPEPVWTFRRTTPPPVIQSLYWQSSPTQTDICTVSMDFRSQIWEYGLQLSSQVVQQPPLHHVAFRSSKPHPSFSQTLPHFYSGLSQCPYTVWRTGSPILSSYVDSTVAFLFQSLPLSLPPLSLSTSRTILSLRRVRLSWIWKHSLNLNYVRLNLSQNDTPAIISPYTAGTHPTTHTS